jgi:hypothetical protein
MAEINCHLDLGLPQMPRNSAGREQDFERELILKAKKGAGHLPLL